MGDVGGEMKASWRSPHAALRPFIAGYTGYRQIGGAAATHRGLPSPYLTMIVAVDDPVTMLAHPNPRQPGGDYWTLVGGLHTAPALIGHPGRQAGIMIAVRPLGARALFGLPAGELFEHDLAVDEVLGPVAQELHERVNATASWDERFAAVDGVLLAGLRPERSVRPEVERAWGLLVGSGGGITVAKVAADVGWSPRYLDTMLRVETGLNPKAAARVARFDAARRLIAARGTTVADVAAACGYHDQAHLARDFRAFAGCSPTTWLAEELGHTLEGATALE